MSHIDSLDEYQVHARRTAIYPGKGDIQGVNYCVLGLVGEAGELANKMKKVYRDHGGFRKTEMEDKILEELGDVLWYTANLAEELGVCLSEVASENLRKLAQRADRGTLQGSGDDR